MSTEKLAMHLLPGELWGYPMSRSPQAQRDGVKEMASV